MMSEQSVMEGEVIKPKRGRKPKSDALAKAEPAEVQKPVPLDSISEVAARLQDVRRFIKKNLKKDLDYGEIFGIPKPFLMQPGAEKIAMWLGVRPEYDCVEKDLKEDHLEVVSRCKLINRKDNQEVCQAIASCTTMESNYRYRWPESKKKPAQEEAAQLKAVGLGKWKRKKTEKGSTVEYVWCDRADNLNIFDERNKVRQIGNKRALVKSIRTLGALSEIFTEDPDEWELPEHEIVQEEPKPTGKVDVGPPTPLTPPKAEIPPFETPKQVTLVTVQWQENNEIAFVSGCNDKMKKEIKENELGIWLEHGQCFSVPADRVQYIQDICDKQGCIVQEIAWQGAKTSDVYVSPKAESHTITQVRAEKGKGHIQVLWNGIWFYCFQKDLFEHLEKGKGKEAQLLTEKSAKGWPHVVGIVRIGDREFHEGVPVIQKDEPRQKSLL